MKIYEGARSKNGAVVRVRDTATRNTRLLDPRYDLRNHSPDGFEWGYGGSGPAQLALAICCDVLRDDERAQRVYQTIKERLIAPIQDDDWNLTEETIRGEIQAAEEVTP